MSLQIQSKASEGIKMLKRRSPVAKRVGTANGSEKVQKRKGFYASLVDDYSHLLQSTEAGDSVRRSGRLRTATVRQIMYITPAKQNKNRKPNSTQNTSKSLPRNKQDKDAKENGVTKKQTETYDPSTSESIPMSNGDEAMSDSETTIIDPDNEIKSDSLSAENADLSAQSEISEGNHDTIYTTINNIAVPVAYFCKHTAMSYEPLPKTVKVGYAFKNLLTHFSQLNSGYLEIDTDTSKSMTEAKHSILYKVDIGTGLVVIQETKIKAAKDDVFFVPSGTRYSIENVTKDSKLVLFFVQVCNN